MIRKALIVFVAVVLCSGPMCAPVTFDRLDANDHLREVCAGYIDDDTWLETGLSLMDQARLEGATEPEVLSGLDVNCASNLPEWTQACWACNTAMADQVYGH
jgi:hypothetical protein